MTYALLLIDALSYLIIADALLSWVVRSPDDFPRNITTRITDPLYAPLRDRLKARHTGGFDISPLVWLIGLHVLRRLLGT